MRFSFRLIRSEATPVKRDSSHWDGLAQPQAGAELVGNGELPQTEFAGRERDVLSFDDAIVLELPPDLEELAEELQFDAARLADRFPADSHPMPSFGAPSKNDRLSIENSDPHQLQQRPCSRMDGAWWNGAWRNWAMPSLTAIAAAAALIAAGAWFAEARFGSTAPASLFRTARVPGSSSPSHGVSAELQVERSLETTPLQSPATGASSQDSVRPERDGSFEHASRPFQQPDPGTFLVSHESSSLNELDTPLAWDPVARVSPTVFRQGFSAPELEALADLNALNNTRISF